MRELVGRWRASCARRPVAWFWAVAVAVELVVLPLFLFTGAQQGLDAAMAATGATFNTDLVSAARLVLADGRATAAVGLSLVQVAAPDLAVLVVGAAAGGGHLRRVARRFRFWSRDVGARRGLAVWAAVVALCCAANLATAGLHALTARDDGFVWNVAPPVGPLLLGLLVAMFLDAGAVFEENGWRGFALPLLQDRYGPLAGTLVLGLLWTAWHLPVKFDLAGYGPGGAAVVAVLAGKFCALSVIMTWAVNRAGGATLPAIAVHGLSNDSVRLGGFVFGDSLEAYLTAELNLLLPLVVVAVALTALTRGRLGAAPVTAPAAPRRAGAR